MKGWRDMKGRTLHISFLDLFSLLQWRHRRHSSTVALEPPHLPPFLPSFPRLFLFPPVPFNPKNNKEQTFLMVTAKIQILLEALSHLGIALMIDRRIKRKDGLPWKYPASHCVCYSVSLGKQQATNWVVLNSSLDIYGQIFQLSSLPRVQCSKENLAFKVIFLAWLSLKSIC